MFIPGIVLCTQLACSVAALPPGKGFQDMAQCEAVVPRMMAKLDEAPYMVGGCIFVVDSWKPTTEQLVNRFKSVFAPPNLREDRDG